jgi:two-component system, cell cycle sensor histidine kinase and response regulator CckA
MWTRCCDSMPSSSPNAAVSEARKLCRELMNAISDAILIFDPRSFRILDANKCAAVIYGYPRKELIGKEMRELTHEVPNYSDLLHTSRAIERTDFNKAGEKIEFLVSLSLIDYWGRKAVLSLNRDITERNKIERAIASSEKRLRLLIASISEILVLIDADSMIRFISPQVERVLGIPAVTVVGKNIFDFIHPDDRERTAAEYSKTVQEPGEAVPSILRIRSGTGHWIPFEIIANNQLHDPDIAGVIFTARDLRFRREVEKAVREANADFEKRVEERTMEMAKANAALRIENQHRRHTESQLQQSVSLLCATLESTADGILVVSNDRIISSCNQKFMEMWHIPRIAIAGLRDEDLLEIAVPQLLDPHAFQRDVENLYSKPDAVSSDTLKLKDGRIFERYSQPQRVGDQIVGRVWSFRDVTHSKLLEEELHQTQKMEAVGRLAGGVAHDFNNLLMLISGYANQMAEDKAFPAKHRDSMEELVEATKRASALIRQLLAFSRKHPVSPELVDLNRVVADMQKMLQRLISDRVTLVVNLCPGPLAVEADPSHIELMIMNLAINSRDAMPDGGILTIKTAAEVLAGEKEDGEAAFSGYAVLEVTDTGFGMSPEIQSHIFEPFFTTKEVGKGTGLGLSAVHGVVELAGGHISVESQPNHGTSLRIYLPRTSAKIVERPEEQEEPANTGHETILLVEDETGIRSMTRVYLESQGYKVLEAANGNEAILISRQYQSTIELVLTDIVMPGMRGDELVRALRQERPGVNAIFISGYPDAQELDPGVSVLEKPFAFPDLARRVRAVLDEAEAEAQQRARAKDPPAKRRA